MADCMYHGQSGPGPCGLCEMERQNGIPVGTYDGYGDAFTKNPRSEESDVAAGIKPLPEKKRAE